MVQRRFPYDRAPEENVESSMVSPFSSPILRNQMPTIGVQQNNIPNGSTWTPTGWPVFPKMGGDNLAPVTADEARNILERGDVRKVGPEAQPTIERALQQSPFASSYGAVFGERQMHDPLQATTRGDIEKKVNLLPGEMVPTTKPSPPPKKETFSEQEKRLMEEAGSRIAIDTVGEPLVSDPDPEKKPSYPGKSEYTPLEDSSITPPPTPGVGLGTEQPLSGEFINQIANAVQQVLNTGQLPDLTFLNDIPTADQQMVAFQQIIASLSESGALDRLPFEDRQNLFNQEAEIARRGMTVKEQAGYSDRILAILQLNEQIRATDNQLATETDLANRGLLEEERAGYANRRSILLRLNEDMRQFNEQLKIETEIARRQMTEEERQGSAARISRILDLNEDIRQFDEQIAVKQEEIAAATQSQQIQIQADIAASIREQNNRIQELRVVSEEERRTQDASARRELQSQLVAAQTQMALAELQNPYAAAAMRMTRGGIPPGSAGLAELGFTMPDMGISVPDIAPPAPGITQTAQTPMATTEEEIRALFPNYPNFGVSPTSVAPTEVSGPRFYDPQFLQQQVAPAVTPAPASPAGTVGISEPYPMDYLEMAGGVPGQPPVIARGPQHPLDILNMPLDPTTGRPSAPSPDLESQMAMAGADMASPRTYVSPEQAAEEHMYPLAGGTPLRRDLLTPSVTDGREEEMYDTIGGTPLQPDLTLPRGTYGTTGVVSPYEAAEAEMYPFTGGAPLPRIVGDPANRPGLPPPPSIPFAGQTVMPNISHFFPGGVPTIGAFSQIDPESIKLLNAIMAQYGITPEQLQRYIAGITPEARSPDNFQTIMPGSQRNMMVRA